jgi:hypothetical protein
MVSERVRWRWTISVDGVESSSWDSLAVARDYCAALCELGYRAELRPTAWVPKNERPEAVASSEPPSQPEKRRP